MKISVIMPVYNGEKYLNQAIDSILNQTYSDFEFIIINDCSTDSTEEIVQSYSDDRIVYLKNEKNSGVAATLNRGLEAARGEYIARMDADDISHPERIEKQVRYMDNNPDVGVCGANAIVFESGEDKYKLVYSEFDEDIRIDMIFNTPFAHPAVIIRNEVLILNNIKYDEQFEKSEDYKMWYDILSISKGHNLMDFLLRYRHHSKQVSNTFVEEQSIVMKKIRGIMYGTLNLGTDEYYDIFCRICLGDRTFIESDYEKFCQFVRTAIKSENIYEKRPFRSTWYSIHYSVYENSSPDRYRFVTISEIGVFLKNILRKIFLSMFRSKE